MAAMRTAAMQTAGGTQAGAEGAGRLYAARTRNSGGIGDAIASSARTAGRELGQESVGIEAANAQLKQKQRQAGLAGLESLNSTEMGAGMNALGLSNSALNSENQWKNPWDQFGLEGMSDATKIAQAYLNGGSGGGGGN
jgi:hypothetical protein